MECGICYSYRLPVADKKEAPGAASTGGGEQGEMPDRMCDNAKCGRPYHRACLVEWLRAIPNTQQSFNTLFGKCPYCQSPITVDAS